MDAGGGSGSAENGLFPSMPKVASFGGGLFPDFKPAMDDTVAMADKADAMSDKTDDKMADAGSDAMSDKAEMADADAGSTGETMAKADSAMAKKESISILHEARKLIEEHADQPAIDVMYANYLVSDEARKKYTLDWYPGIKEPRMFFRWGVCIVFNKPKELEGRHPVLGDPGDPNEGVSAGASRRSGGRGGTIGVGAVSSGGSRSGGARLYKNVDTSRPDGFLLYYTGDFGEKLISHLDSRREDEQRPYYGAMLKDVLEVEIPGEEDEGANDRESRRARSAGGPSQSSAGFGGLSESGGAGRGGRRRGGARNAQALQRTDTSVIDRAMGRSTADKPEDEATGSILPGVSLLGVGSKVDLLERAQSANVDSFIMFNVKVSKSRGSRGSRGARGSRASAPEYGCVTSMKIIDMKTGENLFSSKSLKDSQVDEENEEGEDPVKDQVERAFTTVADKTLRAMDMPSGLNSNVVKKRVGKILSTGKDNPLPAAVEIIGYLEAELLNSDLAETAMSRLFGTDDAKVLVSGSADERLEFLKEKLPDGIGG